MFDYKRPLKAVPLKKINYDITEVEKLENINEQGFELVFDIPDDFDLRRFDEAYFNAGSFAYYTCSHKKFQEIKVFFGNELELKNGAYYLKNKAIRGETSIKVVFSIDLDTIKKKLESE